MRYSKAILSIAAAVISPRSTVAFTPSTSIQVLTRSTSAITSFTPAHRSTSTSNTRTMATKAGVTTPSELETFVSSAGSKLLVVDVRHPDPEVEPGDAKSLAVAGFPKPPEYRPQAVNLPWSRETNGMELPQVDKDTPIITHCGGGGRGQKAKDYLTANGFTNVLNGGGPKETECWAVYGEK
ncbi:hypothetical protein ACHAXN_006831 [Cyclotella atomus]